GEVLAVGRTGQAAHPAVMRLERTKRFAALGVPPDERAVVTRRDNLRLAGVLHVEQGRNVVLMPGPAGHGLLLIHCRIKDVNAIVVAARVERSCEGVDAHRVERAFVIVGKYGFDLAGIDRGHLAVAPQSTARIAPYKPEAPAKGLYGETQPVI